MRAHPEYYVHNVDEVEIVFQRMCHAMDAGTYQKDTHAFKTTCRRLGIKNTYIAINTYLEADRADAELAKHLTGDGTSTN